MTASAITPLKECKVCSPAAKTPCQLASTTCPYRDMDTLR